MNGMKPVLVACFFLTTTVSEDLQEPTANNTEKQQDAHSPTRYMSGFSWSNCGSSDTLASFKSFSLSPDPLVMPGNFSMAFEGETSVDAVSPLPAQIVLKRKVWIIWVTVPCVESLGTCSYEDFCTFIHLFFPPAEGCPTDFIKHSIPCNCPFLTGTYSLPSSVVPMPTFHLPSFLTDGEYDLNLKVQIQGKQLFCINVKFRLSSP